LPLNTVPVAITEADFDGLLRAGLKTDNHPPPERLPITLEF
jgi:hypothetical protein